MGHRRGDLVLQPMALVALAVLAFNDQVLKAAWPGAITGKASDLAGLVLAPLVVVTVVEWSTRSRVGRSTAWLAVVAVGASFTVVQLVPVAGDAYEVVMGLLRWPIDAGAALLGGKAVPARGRARLWPDATDLLTLPALVLPLHALRCRRRLHRDTCDLTPNC